MDLQAILDATDSSEDEDEIYQVPMGLMMPPPATKSPQKSRRPPASSSETPPSRSYNDRHVNNLASPAATATSALSFLTSGTPPTSSGNIDLEQILREDDDDSSSDGYNSSSYRNHQVYTSTSSSHAGSSSMSHQYHTSASATMSSSRFSANPPSSDGSSFQHVTAANNPEDWDVLQAILGEDDDDEEDDDDDYNLSFDVSRFASSKHQTYKQPMNVDLILQKSEDDMWEEEEEETPAPSSSLHDKPILVSSKSKSKPTKISSSSSSKTYKSTTGRFVTSKQSMEDPTAKTTTTTTTLEEEKNDNFFFTAKALNHAQAYEKKLFKSGHRDIVSPLQVKRRLKPKIELGTRMQQKTVSPFVKKTYEKNAQKFNFSGVVENKPMKGLSQIMVDFSNSVAKRTKNKKTALPTALAVNARFLAIGLQTGAILVFDMFESLRQKLGVQGSDQFDVKAAGAVTSIDMSLVHGEFLVAGYTSGYIVLWDIIKGVALKSVIETSNPSPITLVRFLTDIKVVTVDAAGLVNKLNYNKNLLWNSYGVETECLLDGTAGQILAMNTLAPFSFMKKEILLKNQQQQKVFPAAFRKIVMIALSSERSSFAVAVEPTVHVLHRWPKPPKERMDPSSSDSMADDNKANAVYLPCLSWGWALVSGGGHTINPILARAWGCCLQLLRANFPEQEFNSNGQELFQWPAFGVHDEFDVHAPVVALEWLNDRSLVYLTVTNEFTVIDTVMMTLLERLDFSGLKLVYAEFSLSRKVAQEELNDLAMQAENTEFCTTFQNAVRSCDNRLLVLCQDELKTVSIVGAKRRISGLEQDGEWLEALALALDHYENTVKSQEDRRRFSTRDISKHPQYNQGPKSEDEEWIAKLLVRYLNIAVENAPETSSAELPPAFVQSQIELAQSHFQMLAGVCIEFCVTTKRLDLLFGPIFGRFISVGYLSVFLDVLEPYILNDKLDYIAPEAMAHFVEHCKATNGIATVERCLLHMDVTIMDFDSILGLLKANEMYSALFYVFNEGLDDFTTPFEILMERIFDAADTNPPSRERRPDGVPQNDFELYGYKALLYLQNCFDGRTFPQDSKMEDQKVHSVRPQLLQLLLQQRYKKVGVGQKKKRHSKVYGQRALRYPYAHILLLVDPIAMFDTMSMAMNAPDDEFGKEIIDTMQEWEGDVDGEKKEEHSEANRSPQRQDIIRMFLSIIIPDKNDIATTHQSTLHQSKTVVNAFLDFLAEYLIKGVVRADHSVTFLILTRMAHRYQLAKDLDEKQASQNQILQLLTALPRDSYKSEEVLGLVQAAGIHRAALLMHQEGASYWEGSREIGKRALHFQKAIDCYIGDADLDFRKEVFAYVKKECSASSEEEEESKTMDNKESLTMRDALASKLKDLVNLDSLLTAELVADLFVEDLDRVISTFEEEDARFKFLQAIISGELNKVDQVAAAVLNSHLTMNHHHKYLSLMAKLHPELVYEYLSSHDNYRPEDCLKLCRKHEIADASAYLLERMGNVSSALQLILQTLESRMMNLKRTIRGMSTDFVKTFNARASAHRWKKIEMPMSESYQRQEKEIDGVKRILVVALDVCERNSGNVSSRTEHGSQLWFNVLDRLINAKGFLRLSKEQPGHAKVMAGVLSELLRMTMQRMVSSVPLPDLVRKVTSDHSGSRLGELREMIESLLSTYGLELKVFDRSVSIFKYDSQQMQHMHHAIRVKGSNVRSILSLPLNKSSQHHRTLESSLNSSDVLQIVERGNARVLDADSRVKSRNDGQGLGNVLSRLRSRRHDQQVVHKDPGLSAALNLMTFSESLYQQGDVSPDSLYFEDRMIGALGDAEHRGRLMSFMY